MPKTIQLIQTQTLTGTAASVTFSNIPQNFQDLKLVISLRSDQNSVEAIGLNINGQGVGANITSRYVDSGAGTPRSGTAVVAGIVQGTDYTSSTFSSNELYFPNYTSGTQKSISVDYTTENNATANYSGFSALLWAQTAAITSLSLTRVNGGNFVANSTFTLYGIGSSKASGGTITYDDKYTYHTFTSTGSFTALERIKGAEILCIAGGGGAGQTNAGGGGGGGVLYQNNQTLNAGTTYTALVGAGGAAGVSAGNRGSNGGNSVLSTVIAIGGGGGGSYNAGERDGNLGGSGGGGGYGPGDASPNQNGQGGQPTSGQGFAGGNTNLSFPYTGAGGGGAGGAGSNVTANGNGTVTAGGVGTSAYTAWAIATSTGIQSGSNYLFAPGGAGTYGTSPTNTAAQPAGTANTGGGGGAPSAGGSGLIIVRYPTD